MRLSSLDLENLTPFQFNLMREGYELDQKYQWERTRFGAYWTYIMAGRQGEDISIEEFRPLDEEDLKKVPSAIDSIPVYTPAQEEYFNKLFNPGK